MNTNYKFNIFFTFALFLMVMHVYTSNAITDRYWSLNDAITNNEANPIDGNDEKPLNQRAAHFLFPATSFIFPSNEHQDFVSAKRQSFGRKHHWDAFFGRRR